MTEILNKYLSSDLRVTEQHDINSLPSRADPYRNISTIVSEELEYRAKAGIEIPSGSDAALFTRVLGVQSRARSKKLIAANKSPILWYKNVRTDQIEAVFNTWENQTFEDRLQYAQFMKDHAQTILDGRTSSLQQLRENIETQLNLADDEQLKVDFFDQPSSFSPVVYGKSEPVKDLLKSYVRTHLDLNSAKNQMKIILELIEDLVAKKRFF